MKTRFSAIIVAVAASIAVAMPAVGAELRVPGISDFYGGVALRTPGADGMGVTLGHLSNEWVRFAFPSADDGTGSRTLMFGGYRWRNDFALEAAVETSERYALQRKDGTGRGGVGLALPGLAQEAAARSWNVDLYGSWAFWRSLSLYGRFGYAQADGAVALTDPRRARDGVNYGVGLRYDMTRSLGLKLEYARFGHPAGDPVGTTLPESDQVQFGLQYRF
jgi:opacity protein-like surface antigen